jgi:hypothetical protein
VDATEKMDSRNIQEKAESQDCERWKPEKNERLGSVGPVMGRLSESCQALRAKGPDIHGPEDITVAFV